MARAFDPYRFTSPGLFLLSMVVFLIIAGFIIAILYSQISTAFMANPGLNGLIVLVLVFGILLTIGQVVRLMPEVSWANSFRQGDEFSGKRDPVLLAPMKALLGNAAANMSLNTASLRSILDSIGNRLDDLRDITRYLIGLLVFLGLLGTFWGLLQTIGSIGDTIRSLDPGSGDTNDILEALKSGLSAPLDGMGTAFSSSLFGLGGSLILGFLDLQAGRAQTRFYTELENWLSSITDMTADFGSLSGASGEELREHLDSLTKNLQSGGGESSGRATAAMASLAESIQGLVQHMRADQQAMRQQQTELQETLNKLNKFFDKASKS
ncbi:flagellar motor protein MotA [Salaquimonas pukyongi]|uniref:flagellar motor protein MotA n=1 Tax=Salaquimonas pukyongi TaxID=2712698 RepID=UPI00096BC80C